MFERYIKRSREKNEQSSEIRFEHAGTNYIMSAVDSRTSGPLLFLCLTIVIVARVIDMALSSHVFGIENNFMWETLIWSDLPMITNPEPHHEFAAILLLGSSAQDLNYPGNWLLMGLRHLLQVQSCAAALSMSVCTQAESKTNALSLLSSLIRTSYQLASDFDARCAALGTGGWIICFYLLCPKSEQIYARPPAPDPIMLSGWLLQ